MMFDRARICLDEIAPKRRRIDGALAGKLIHERLDGEDVGEVRDAAQARCAQTAFLRHRFAEPIGNRRSRRIEAVERDAVAAVLPFESYRVLERRHLVAGLAVMERDQPAGCIEAGAQIMRRQRTEAAVVDVVLARPHHLDRLLDRFRQHHRVVDVFLVAVAAPAEAAAHQHVVVDDLVGRDAEGIGRDRHARWSCSARRTRPRRHRRRAIPRRPRSAAPSGRDRRGRSGYSPSTTVAAVFNAAGASPSLTHSFVG